MISSLLTKEGLGVQIVQVICSEMMEEKADSFYIWKK